MDYHLGDEVWIDAFMDDTENWLNKTNQELIGDFKNHFKDTFKTESIQKIERTLNLFLAGLNKSLLLVNTNDLDGFFKRLRKRRGQLGREKVMPDTLRKHINNLSTFYNFLKAKKIIRQSPISDFRELTLKPFLRINKYRNVRQVPTTDEIIKMVNSRLKPMDRAVLILPAKTGIRANELIGIELSDIDWDNQCIRLRVREEKYHKRRNSIVFFDDEMEKALKSWVNVRKRYVTNGTNALFLNRNGEKMQYSTLNNIVHRAGEIIGIHDKYSENLDERFTLHCFRWWFTTVLKERGMNDSYIAELRGDDRKGKNSTEYYYQIPLRRLREEYLKNIPRFWV